MKNSSNKTGADEYEDSLFKLIMHESLKRDVFY